MNTIVITAGIIAGIIAIIFIVLFLIEMNKQNKQKDMKDYNKEFDWDLIKCKSCGHEWNASKTDHFNISFCYNCNSSDVEWINEIVKFRREQIVPNNNFQGTKKISVYLSECTCENQKGPEGGCCGNCGDAILTDQEKEI